MEIPHNTLLCTVQMGVSPILQYFIDGAHVTYNEMEL